MADLTRTIEILFEGTNRTGTAITAVGRDLDSLSYRVSNVAAPFAEATAAVASLDAVLATLAAAGLAYAFHESSKLQSSFTELKKVAGDSADELNAAKENAIGLSNAYGDSAASILNSTASYVQAGYTVQESMILARNSMDLVIAGGVNASQASEILIASLKGFREPAEEAGRLIDILNEVSNRYATDIEQLGVGMAGISPIARTMGFSMEETAGLLTPVIEIFRSGDEAAVALKTGLLKLVDDAKPVGEALASIGVAQRDANGNLRSGKDILLDVSQAFTTLDQNQKLFVTQQLVGIEQSARMVEVFDNLGKTSEIASVAMSSTGSAAREVAERLRDPEVAINRLVQGFSNLASSIGDDFQQAGTGAVNGITAVVNSIGDAVNAGAFDPLHDALNDFLNGVEGDLTRLAETLPAALDRVDYSGFLDALGNIRDTAASLFDGIDFGDPDSLADAIQRVVDTFESLANFSRGIGEVFVDVAGYIGNLIDWFNSLDTETQSFLGNLSGIGTAVTAIAAPIGLVATALSGFGGVMTTSTRLAGSLANGVGNLVVSFPTLFSVVSAGVGGWTLGTVLRETIPQIDETAQSILGLVDKYTGLFGVYDEQQRVAEEGAAAEERLRQVMQDRAQAAEEVAEASFESNLAIVNSVDNAADHTEWLTGQMRELGILVEEPKTVEIDTADAEQKLATLEYYREATGTWETITIPVDATEVEAAKKEIEEIPAVKRLEFETDLAIAEVQAQAETLQTAFKFKAELDIAEVQANAEVMKSAFDSVGQSVQSTASAASSMFGDLANFEGSLSTKWLLQDTLREQVALEREALETQKTLAEAQAKYLRAKAEAIQSGEALINVDAGPLKPHLEAIMWEIFAAIQIRATQEGLDVLTLGGLPE